MEFNIKESQRFNISILINHHQDLERLIWCDVRLPMDFNENKTRGNHIWRERGNRLINNSAFIFQNLSRGSLRQWCRTNRIIERNSEFNGERRRKERKEKNGRMPFFMQISQVPPLPFFSLSSANILSADFCCIHSKLHPPFFHNYRFFYFLIFKL